MNRPFAEVILPLAIPSALTYAVSLDHQSEIQIGQRVEVPFRKSSYMGVVMGFVDNPPKSVRPKTIRSLIDAAPVVTPVQIKLWVWMADFYCCTLGEVMLAALPAYMRLETEMILTLSPFYETQWRESDIEIQNVIEAFQHRDQISIDDLAKITQTSSAIRLAKNLIERKVLYLHEQLSRNYKPKVVTCIRWAPDMAGEHDKAFEQLQRAPKQAEALLGFIQLSQTRDSITRQELATLTDCSTSIINSLAEKGILELYDREVSRIHTGVELEDPEHQLTDLQAAALEDIHQQFQEKDVILLHGVTSSGKTLIYTKRIEAAIEAGKQVLFMVPEIALTSQLISRLKRIFGDKLVAYHSRINNNERIEVWNAVLNGAEVVVSPRSGLFLPFQDLGLVIMDEEHDPSYKQHDPAPRYHARTSAVWMARQFGAKVILGSATPSIETYYFSRKGTFGYVALHERFGGIQMPDIEVIPIVKKKGEAQESLFTEEMLAAIKKTLDDRQQVILFQNRRGYAPMLHCTICGWYDECPNCDVSLVYHQYTENLRCHYCGYQSKIPSQCPQCQHSVLSLSGFGTEKIADELKIFFPEVRIGRMDKDTTSGRYSFDKIIADFEEQSVQILVGTQMVTKGLDFDNVGLVGVLHADHLMHYPDFRSTERAFQLMTQVSGRAGRKNKRGKVLIQALRTKQPVLQEVVNNDYAGFYAREIKERQDFGYPPFMRQIKITVKHTKRPITEDAAKMLTHELKKQFGQRVLGPAWPSIVRIRNRYQMCIFIKLERNRQLQASVRQALKLQAAQLRQLKGYSTVRIIIDVDPV